MDVVFFEKEPSALGADSGLQYTRSTDSELYTLMCRAAHESNTHVAYVRGKFCGTLDGFFQEISSSMRFPNYFGWNWAAFDECITDLEWLSFSGLLIVIDDFDLVFGKEKRREREQLRDLLLIYLKKAVAYWSDQKIPIAVCLNHHVSA